MRRRVSRIVLLRAIACFDVSNGSGFSVLPLLASLVSAGYSSVSGDCSNAEDICHRFSVGSFEAPATELMGLSSAMTYEPRYDFLPLPFSR
jgi:hypothetical protein